MPVSREEFDEGRVNLRVQVLQYLNARRDEAFTADEVLYALTTVYERRATIIEVTVILRALVNGSHLETKEVSGAQMYTIVISH